MSPNLLHKFWCLVEEAQAMPKGMDDANLAEWLLQQIQAKSRLNGTEASDLNRYISSRLPLIREILHEGQVSYS